MSLEKLKGTKKIGLIAGNGKFPLLFAREASRRGIDVVVVAVKKDTSSRINRLAKKVYWLSLKDYARMFEIFKKEDIKKVIMAGQVNPQNLFYKDMGDDALKALLAAVRDKRAHTVFKAVADKLAEHSIELLDSTLFLEDYLSPKGTLTKTEPDAATWKDVHVGFDMAKRVACLDIGQTLVVRNGAIVAVEAIEGTDAAIQRGGKVASGGVVVIKVSKPDQDMRFDIPVIGLRTIQNLRRVRAKCLAIEAHRTLIIDRDACIRMADKYRIAIVAL